MNKDDNFIKKIKYSVLIFIFISLFISVFLINTKVRLYGDDWFYYTFSSSGILYYVEKNIQHYFLANGRAIVHLLVTVFLKLPMIFWVIINSTFLLVISLIILKISNCYNKTNIDNYLYSALIIIFSISTLDARLTSQSVYWLTGSFNYVYPVFLLFLLIYFYYSRNEKIHWYLYFIGFLAGASVEQAGMMAFGFILLNIIYKNFILKKKIAKEDITLAIIILVGFLTVILAPGMFHRVSVEDVQSTSIGTLIFDNSIYQMNTFLLSNIMFSTHILVVLGSFMLVIRRIKLRSKLKMFEKIIIFLGFLSSLAIVLSNINGTLYIQENVSDIGQFFILFMILLGYVLLCFYSAYILYFYSDYKLKALPMILLILAFGSQFMMIVSPTYGNRNLIFAIFPLVIYSAIALQCEMKFDLIILIFAIYYFVIFNEKPDGLNLLILFIIANLINVFLNKSEMIMFFKQILVISLTVYLAYQNFVPIYDGYNANAKIYDSNLIKAKEYDINSGKPLVQTKMDNYKCRWVMPYENQYYAPYYNMYININQNQYIEWTY